MLYFKEYITESTLVGVWKIEESWSNLLSKLSHHQWLDNLASVKSESRMLEILGVRVLLKELVGEEKQIYYNETGKPFLYDQSSHISISHSKGYVAIALSARQPIGLDIELISEKIRRVQSRVISEVEHIDPNNDLIHLLLHWSAKEAMFKYLDTQGVDFREHLFVEKFTPEEKGCFTTSESRTELKHEFNAYYRVETDFVMVCLESQ